jgi:hypothetical protein
MFRSYSSSGTFGKIAHLALLGVGILFLGPIALALAATALGVALSIVAAMLPFVLIGALAYGPYLLVRHLFGHQPLRPARLEARKMPVPPQRVHPFVVEPAVRRPIPVVPAVAPLPARRRQTGVVARVLGEVFCGALVGGILGAVTVLAPVSDWQVHNLVSYTALGASIGAVVGFVVGGPRPAPAEKTQAVS